jgi:hypothetical protein
MEIDWNYKEEDWVFERSSGYAGSRNIITQEWLSSDELYQKELILKEFETFKKLCKFFKYLYDVDKYSSDLVALKLKFTEFKKQEFQIF